MGDRISVAFSNGTDKSVVLFSHWGGMAFAMAANEYAENLFKRHNGESQMLPIDRWEPNTVMVDFIRYITKDLDEVSSNLYLGATDSDGDDSDNGHFVVHITKDGVSMSPYKVSR